MSKKGYTKTVNFITPGTWVLISIRGSYINRIHLEYDEQLMSKLIAINIVGPTFGFVASTPMIAC